jgi:integrase
MLLNSLGIGLITEGNSGRNLVPRGVIILDYRTGCHPRSHIMPEQTLAREAEQLVLFDVGGIDMKKLRAKRTELSEARRSPNTRRCYAADWRQFQEWCTAAGRSSLPANGETLALFVAQVVGDGSRASTISRKLSAIASMHRDAGHSVPDTKEARRVVAGSARLRKQPSLAKSAITVEQLRAISKQLAKRRDLRGVRDRAIIVFGFATGMRRSELSALDLADVRLAPKGLTVEIRSSKTDQVGAGREIGVWRARTKELCPVRALRHWISFRGRWKGPLFVQLSSPWADKCTRERLGPDAIYDVVKRTVELVGADPSDYGAHSLRAGMVTAALATGAAESAVMRRTGHKSRDTLDRYYRPATVFASDPLARAL